MIFAVFPHRPWAPIPCFDALRGLLRFGAVYFVADGAAAKRCPDGIVPIPSDRLGTLERPAMALIYHPYWIGKAAALRPARTATLIPEGTFEENEPLWRERLRRCVALSDLFGAESETAYLEQALRKEAVLLLRDPDPLPGAEPAAEGNGGRSDWEVLLRHAIIRLLDEGTSPAWASAVQQRLLARRYALLRERTGPHETVSFLLSVYEYLLGLPGAASHLLEAFQDAAGRGRPDSLLTHYRFLSAIRARSGSLNEGLDAYGITALTEKDKSRYEELLRHCGSGRTTLAKALLLRYNDDWAGALALLRGEPAPEARAALRELLTEAGLYEEAFARCGAEPANFSRERVDYLTIRGKARLAAGDRQGGIGDLLEAAEFDREALGFLQDVKKGDDALSRLKRFLEEADGSGTEAGNRGRNEVRGESPGGLPEGVEAP